MKKYLALLLVAMSFATVSKALVVLDEPFAYANGALTNVSTRWTNHSGALGQMDVTSGRVNLTQAEAEDMNTGLAGAPYSGPTLYASFVINLSALPLGQRKLLRPFQGQWDGELQGPRQRNLNQRRRRLLPCWRRQQFRSCRICPQGSFTQH